MSELQRLRDKNLEWRILEKEIVVLDLTASTYLAVNASGAALWESLARGASEQDLRDLLVQRYAVTPDVAQRDVARFLADLRARGLIDASPAGA